MIRHTLLAAAVVMLAAPAIAQNVANVSNLSAGIGNFAAQGALVRQR